MAHRYDVTGDPRYIQDVHQTEAKLLELFRQLRDKKGYPGDLELLNTHLQDAIELNFRGSYLDPYHFYIEVDYDSSVHELFERSECYSHNDLDAWEIREDWDRIVGASGKRKVHLAILFPEIPIVKFLNEIDHSGLIPGIFPELIALSGVCNRIGNNPRRYPIYAPGTSRPPTTLPAQGGCEMLRLASDNKLSMERLYGDAAFYRNEPEYFDGQVAFLVRYPPEYPRVTQITE